MFFVSWLGSGWLINTFGVAGAGYIFYRYIRMNTNFEECLTCERESPVKSITKIHNEHVKDDLLLCLYSVVISLGVYFIQKIIEF